MKILILTHPLGTNYGGMMQCYALKTILELMGHTVEVANMQPPQPYVKRIIREALIWLNHPRYNSPKFKRMRRFLSQNFSLTKPIYTNSDLCKYIKTNKIDAVFVGSDQVWRKDFVNNYDDFAYFLNCAQTGVKRIAYAASFGHNIWEYNAQETKVIDRLLSTFNGVSVREDYGVEMCSTHTTTTPKLVLDPTFLIPDSHYSSIASQRLINKKYIFVYWLWNKSMIEKTLATIPNLEEYEVVNLSMYEGTDFVSVEDWLSYIKYADIIITDSFHGCAFSVIFSKRFIYPIREDIYDGRRESLFNMLSINHDKIGHSDYLREYEIINKRKNRLVDEAKTFINSSLS